MSRFLPDSIPAETWLEIFSHATLESERTEFNVDALTVSDFMTTETMAVRSLSGVISDEQWEIIEMRRNIVMVCKSWYMIGIQALWSHLIIRIDSRSLSYRRILGIIARNPDLAPFVTRLGFSYKENVMNEDAIIHGLLGRLPNLRIFSGPLLTYPHKLRRSNERFASSDVLENGRGPWSAWKTIRLLDLVISPVNMRQNLKIVDKLELPLLESLRIHSYLTNPGVDHLTKCIASNEDWIHFLSNNGKTLQKLWLRFSRGLYFRGPISMPQLSDLYLFHSSLNNLYQDGEPLLKARNLRRISALDAKFTRFDVIGFPELRGFPNIQDIHLRFDPNSLIPDEAESVYDGWRKRGIAVKVDPR